MPTKKTKADPKKLKGMKRAAQSADAHRLSGDIPLIVDTTELITPEVAEKMLQKNKANRPISWPKVEQYKKMMLEDKWHFHSQGIILDETGNILTGQKRLWAVAMSGIAQYFRVSRGTPAQLAHLIDRGTPQSARDLASRKTERKHSPTENSICRAWYAIEGNLKPTADDIAFKLTKNSDLLQFAMEQARRVKKTKPLIMALAAICHLVYSDEKYKSNFQKMSEYADAIEQELSPLEPKQYWNKGAAFNLAMTKAVEICKNQK